MRALDIRSHITRSREAFELVAGGIGTRGIRLSVALPCFWQGVPDAGRERNIEDGKIFVGDVATGQDGTYHMHLPALWLSCTFNFVASGTN